MELMTDYNLTTYRVFIDSSSHLDILIDQLNKDLDKLLGEAGVQEFAFITAWNPFSVEVSDSENEKANADLASDLDLYKVYKGLGIPAQPSEWDAEESYFVLGITKTKAKELGKKYRQNAIVYGQYGSKPEVLKLV